MLEGSVFVLLSCFLLGGSITMVSQKQPLFSAFGFLLAMIALAGLFALLHNSFLALAQVMVSVGAVVVLSLITILSVNAKEQNLPQERYKFVWIALYSVVVAPIGVLLYTTLCHIADSFTDTQVISTKLIGATLFSDWVLPFEIVSILLLVALLGSLVIAREYKSIKKSQ